MAYLVAHKNNQESGQTRQQVIFAIQNFWKVKEVPKFILPRFQRQILLIPSEFERRVLNNDIITIKNI